MHTVTVSQLRQQFLDFFASYQHIVVPSAPVVPAGDPTLLFVNAGMVPFKEAFTGQRQPLAPRLTSAQKCIRAGGKHNDLENVGYTARHHTFFEMLGNFSFGDYFKEEAISFAWAFVHDTLKLPKERLWVTVYHEDTQARDLWMKIAGLPHERIIPIATADNFWSMGDTGPCGPCSEIFYDHGPRVAGGPPGSPDADGDRFVEIWNLVFMQYEQRSSGDRIALPRPCIDTGMGLERMAAVMQGVSDNYQIDLFQRLMQALGALSDTHPDQPSHKVIVDHLRSSAFIMADGVLPSNEGRGYVLRRILRRAIRHAHLLGIQDIILARMVAPLIQEMGHAYPELARAQTLLEMQMQLEEERFRETLDRGLRILHTAISTMTSGQCLPGEMAFQLYDTYGFPIDLTQTILQEQGLTVDIQGFDQAMTQQKQEARKHWGKGEAHVSDTFWTACATSCGPTDFIGYQDLEGPARIQALIHDQQMNATVQGPAHVQIVTAQTPFYGTSGGQVGDTGVLVLPDGHRFNVTDTEKREGLFIHHAFIPQDHALHVGQEGRWYVDTCRRMNIRRHHSASHLLHAALRMILGTHVSQKGSLVEPHRLRFDFSHHKPMTSEEKHHVEDWVNHAILANAPVYVDTMSYTHALQKGALALFGEKYADTVRMVSMGDEHGDAPHSVELCGGTHVAQTGDIGLFLIHTESGVASGIRRIEAVAGLAALDLVRHHKIILDQASTLLKCGNGQIIDRLTQINQQRSHHRKPELSEIMVSCQEQQWSWNNVDVCLTSGREMASEVMRRIVDVYRTAHPQGVIVVLSVNADRDRISVVAGVGQDCLDRYNAIDLVRAISTCLDGKGGGGRPEFAQGGGTNPDKIDQVSHVLEALIVSPDQKPVLIHP